MALSKLRGFPIMSKNETNGYVSWSDIAKHENQARKNHEQTLERLAERGGLSPCEAVAVFEDRWWSAMTQDDAWKRLADFTNVVRGHPC